MAISELQNFYKESIAIATGTGAGNIYVTIKPVPTNGFLVISPGSESLREIIRYTGTGTDGNGDYVTVANIADRGLGGTTAQVHEVGEPVRMNYTAEHQKEIDDTIVSIVAAGAPNANTTVTGISKLSTAPADPADPIAVGTNDPRMNATTGVTADQTAALAGGGDFGTPSGTNKFVTEELTRPIQIVTFTSSGTWTKDAGLKYVVVEAVGGGGGGEYDTASGDGGGGGAYVKKIILASELGATETVTIGAGGTGGTIGSRSGTAGGNTTFGSHLTAAGGAGAADGGSGGAGGVASGGDVNINGQAGGVGYADGNQSSTTQWGGFGGNSFLSVGGPGLKNSQVQAGYGYGGRGGADDGGSNGVDGAPGIVIVTEYYS